MNERRELTDEQCAKLAPLLLENPAKGRPNKDHRTVLEGISWVQRTGAPWREMPPRFGRWKTVASRFNRWRTSGLSDPVLAASHAEAERDGRQG